MGSKASSTAGQVRGKAGGLMGLINQGRAAANKEATADWRVALSANRAGAASLAGMNSKIQAEQAVLNKRTSRAIGKLSDAARANARSVRSSMDKTTAAYGSGLGILASGKYAPARAAASGGVKTVGAAGKQAAGATKVAGVTGELAGQELSALSAAGKYALAQALQQRGIIDSQTFAALEGQIIGEQMQEKYYRFQQRYDQNNPSKNMEAAKAQLLAGINDPTAPWAESVAEANAAAIGNQLNLSAGQVADLVSFVKTTYNGQQYSPTASGGVTSTGAQEKISTAVNGQGTFGAVTDANSAGDAAVEEVYGPNFAATPADAPMIAAIREMAARIWERRFGNGESPVAPPPAGSGLPVGIPGVRGSGYGGANS